MELFISNDKSWLCPWRTWIPPDKDTYSALLAIWEYVEYVEYLDNTIETLVFDIMICLKLFDAHHKQVLWHEGKSNVQCYGRQIQFGIFEIIDTQYNLLECATFYASP